ncbi:MAG: HigA family addiction module antidote protein [Phycisphaerales bacterium]|nr:HigA family addiction module antidote protein [Phycisphaerales bacterium]
MPPRKHKPIHPGEVLLKDFMEPLGITAYRVAKECGTSAQNTGRVIKGERGIGGELALRLARYFGTSPEFWMNLQAQYELGVAEDRSGKEIARRVRPHDAA